MTIGTFSAGIGALIVDEATGRYLLLKRSPEKDYAAGAWECVTGRVDQGEGFEDALHREVREELDTEVQPMFIVGTTHFYRGPERPENELVGIVYCCTCPNPEQMRLSLEHIEFRWLTLNEARDLLNESNLAEYWLVKVIERAEAGRRLYPAELLDLHRRIGFELDS